MRQHTEKTLRSDLAFGSQPSISIANRRYYAGFDGCLRSVLDASYEKVTGFYEQARSAAASRMKVKIDTRSLTFGIPRNRWPDAWRGRLSLDIPEKSSII